VPDPRSLNRVRCLDDDNGNGSGKHRPCQDAHRAVKPDLLGPGEDGPDVRVRPSRRKGVEEQANRGHAAEVVGTLRIGEIASQAEGDKIGMAEPARGGLALHGERKRLEVADAASLHGAFDSTVDRDVAGGRVKGDPSMGEPASGDPAEPSGENIFLAGGLAGGPPGGPPGGNDLESRVIHVGFDRDRPGATALLVLDEDVAISVLLEGELSGLGKCFEEGDNAMLMERGGGKRDDPSNHGLHRSLRRRSLCSLHIGR